MERPNRKDYINKATKIQLIADQERYIDFIEKKLKAINYTPCCTELNADDKNKYFISGYRQGYGDAMKDNKK